MVTATHTHCGPGGYFHHALYNSTTGGFRALTFRAITDGITEAALAAVADLAPARLRLCHGELTDAGVNRSRRAFDRNPAADRADFPDAIDPQTTLLAIEREGRLVGAVNWFATHNTSMTNRNRLVSSDNKGYAALHWERTVAEADHPGGQAPQLVAAFAQTNAGDISPNLWLAPGRGPTGDQFENTRIIGTRQYEAAAALTGGREIAAALTGAGEISRGLDARTTDIHLSAVDVRPAFTGDGRTHRTSPPVAGAAAFAGALVDGPGFKGFRPGANPLWDALSRRLVYPFAPALRDAQHPKALILPAGPVNRVRAMVQEHARVQLLCIGPLFLIGVPAEVTITAGLRLRRTVAAIIGADLPDVLVAGYSNGYVHYVTTPEEYDAQEYEGGSTLFGRWELPALCQTVAHLGGVWWTMAGGTASGTAPRRVAEAPRQLRYRDAPAPCDAPHQAPHPDRP